MAYNDDEEDARSLGEKFRALRRVSLPRVFIIYEHRLFNEILVNVIGRENVVGAVERATTPLTSIVAAMNDARPTVVILEAEADGNSAWHLLLSGEARRVLVLDMERGVVRHYEIRTSAIDTLEELLDQIGPE